MDALRVLSRDSILQKIDDGHIIFIYSDFVIKVPPGWLQLHPGGDIVIQHMIGRDATDEINAYHLDQVIEKIKSYKIGRYEGIWENVIPPIQREAVNTRVATDYDREQIERDIETFPSVDLETQHNIQLEYRKLHERIKAANLYKCSYEHYLVYEASRYLSLLFLTCICVHFEYYIIGAVFFGLFLHQLTFVAHDVAHMEITGNYITDMIIGILIADFGGGLSIGWWKRNHNTHHIVTNAPEHDPDIQHMPFMAITPKLLRSLYSTYYQRIMAYDIVARTVIAVQKWTFYPLLTLGRFNLYRLSFEYIIRNQSPKSTLGKYFRSLEIAGMIFFWFWYGYLFMYRLLPDWKTRIIFTIICNMVTSPLHIQITLSHFASSTSDLGPLESFPQRQLRTTTDIACPEYLDFIHGGLQFQAVHHLFPRIPRHNLRKTQVLVKEFSEKVGIHYRILNFLPANIHVLNILDDVTAQAKLLNNAASHMSSHGGKIAFK